MNMSSTSTVWQELLSSPRFAGSLQVENFIGVGRFGVLYRHETFAVKLLSFQNRLDEMAPVDSIDNTKLLLSLNHNSIVKLFRIERGEKQVYLFFELMEGGSVAQLIESLNFKGQYLSESSFKNFVYQILQGLQYLHEQSIVHCDFKPENLMLDTKQTIVKITGFGYSKQVNKSNASTAAKSTWLYMAPEVVRSENYSTKSDVWSLGVTLVEMISNKPMFPKWVTTFELIKRISELGKSTLQTPYDISERKDLSNDVVQFIDSVLQPLPAFRPSASALLVSEYLKDTEDPRQEPVDSLDYALSLKSKGRHLIINNVNYRKASETRHGSELDVDSLIRCSDCISFTTEIENDLTAKQMMDCINLFATDDVNQSYSSVIITILAHGLEGGISGVDGQLVCPSAIIEALSSDKAPFLMCKPKVLIIQACRGRALAKSLHVVEPDGAATRESTINLRGALTDTSDDSKPFEARLDDDRDEDSALLNFAGSKSDIVVAYSTYLGDTSFRDKTEGTFFIQSLCKTVTQHWKTMSLLDILTTVSGRTATAVNNMSDEYLTQVPQLVSTLRKRFFLAHPSERPASDRFVARSKLANKNIRRENELILIVGESIESCSLQAFNPKTISWSDASKMSEPRKFAGAAFWKGSVVVAGGESNSRALNTAEQYDPETNQWHNFAQLIVARKRLSLVAYEDSLFAIGGATGAEPLLIVEKYDSKANEWLLAPYTKEKRDMACAAASNELILVCGGYDNSHAQGTCEYYESGANAWKAAAQLNVARYRATMATFGDKFYIFGGSNSEGKISTAEQYDFKLNKWTLLDSRLDLNTLEITAACTFGGIYIFGNKRKVTFFNPADGEFKELIAMPSYFKGPAAVSFKVSETALKRFCSSNKM